MSRLSSTRPPRLSATLLLALLCPALPLIFGGCQRPEPDPLPFSQRFALGLGDRTIQVQVALSSAEIRNGLMFRDSLEPDEGMIFVFEEPRELGFWMRNTRIPLDVGYFSPDGVLREVYPLHPFDETVVRSRSTQLQFALEMNQGWFARHGIGPGARLDRQSLADAIRQRGYDPQKYLRFDPD